MRLIDYLDKGATLGAAAPCLTMGEKDMSYGDVQRLTWRVARALARSGVKPGDKVAICRAMTRSHSPASSASRASAPSGVRSTREMRRPRTASSSMPSTARASSSTALTRRSWSRCGPTCPSFRFLSASTSLCPLRRRSMRGSRVSTMSQSRSRLWTTSR